MREIKFRCWHRQDFEMSETFTLQEAIRGNVYMAANTEHLYMQYTGLKDKHDVEIYEHPELLS